MFHILSDNSSGRSYWKLFFFSCFGLFWVLILRSIVSRCVLQVVNNEPENISGCLNIFSHSWSRSHDNTYCQFSSVAQSCPTLCDPMGCSTPGFPVLHHHSELAQTQVHRVSDAIQPSHPQSSPLFLASIFPSSKVFSNELALPIRWPKYWSFSFSISPSNEYSGLISFRIDWLDLLAVQGTLKRLVRHHNLKAPILLCSAFFMVQFLHPYVTTGKTIGLTRQTLSAK